MEGDRIRRCIEAALQRTGCSQVAFRELARSPDGSWIAYFNISGSCRVLENEPLVLTIGRCATEETLTKHIIQRIDDALQVWMAEVEGLPYRNA